MENVLNYFQRHLQLEPLLIKRASQFTGDGIMVILLKRKVSSATTDMLYHIIELCPLCTELILIWSGVISLDLSSTYSSTSIRDKIGLLLRFRPQKKEDHWRTTT